MNTHRAKTSAVIAAAAIAAALALPIAQAAPAGKPSGGPGRVEAKVEPQQRGIYWGAWIGNQLTGNQPPWDMSAVGHFSSLVGKGLSLLEFAAPFADCSASPCDFYEFPTYEMQTIR